MGQGATKMLSLNTKNYYSETRIIRMFLTFVYVRT